MNAETTRALEAIAAFLASGTFLIALIRLVFFTGKLISAQERLMEEAKELATAFKKYAETVDAILLRHEGEINEIRTEIEIKSRIEDHARKGNKS